jgi:hypothetical protein
MFLWDGGSYYYYMGGVSNVTAQTEPLGPDPSKILPQLMLAEDLGQTLQ